MFAISGDEIEEQWAMYEMIVASGTPQRRGGWREEEEPDGRGKGGGREEQGRGRGRSREEEGRNCGGSREDMRRGGGGREDEGRRTGGGGKDESGRRGKDEGGRTRGVVREETEGRRGGGAREEDRRTTGRKDQKGGGGGNLREEELVRKMEECGLGPVRRLEVRGGRALFTPQVSILTSFHFSLCFTKSGPVE